MTKGADDDCSSAGACQARGRCKGKGKEPSAAVGLTRSFECTGAGALRDSRGRDGQPTRTCGEERGTYMRFGGRLSSNPRRVVQRAPAVDMYESRGEGPRLRAQRLSAVVDVSAREAGRQAGPAITARAELRIANRESRE